MEIGLEQDQSTIEDGFHNVSVKVTVTATIADKTMFPVEAAMGGIFQIRNIPEPELQPLLAVHCANIIFPYARELISDAVQRMGYPAIYLQPINFGSDLPGPRPAAARTGCSGNQAVVTSGRTIVTSPRQLLPLVLAFGLSAAAAVAHADFRQTVDNATVGYEGPSAKATRQFLYSRGTPVEVLVSIEGWVKVRDATGTLVWLERKALADRSNVQVKVPVADVQAAADAASPLCSVPSRACCCSSSPRSRPMQAHGHRCATAMVRPALSGSTRSSAPAPPILH